MNLGMMVGLAIPAGADPMLDRGEYLVGGIMGCGNCHTPLGPEGPVAGMELAGRLVEKNPAFTAIAPNITPASRISDWSGAELARAIREGIRPDGSVIGPPMPFVMYRGLSDTDLAAVVAFLRTVPAVDHDAGPSVYNIPLPPAYGPPVESVPEIAPAVSVDYGEYLAGPVAHCMECHTPMGPKGPMIDTDLGRGGFEFHGPWGTSVASNLTSSADGLAEYTDDEIKAMIVQGTRPDGAPMAPPMPYGYLAQMSAEDLDAIVLYLRQLPPLEDG
ncbi:MAG: cytochrome C [Rhodobacteraceae bacterium]|nr:cytochrome C [Paracoccaceae bacterium]